MSGKKKNTQKTDQTTTQSSSNFGSSSSSLTPYESAAGGLNSGLGMAQSWMQNPNSSAIYSGDRVADLSGATQQGMAGLVNNQGYGVAQDVFGRTARGDFLSPSNPYMQGLQDSIAESVMPGLNATFARSGMTGSTIHQNQLAKGMASAMAPHLFGAYETERNRQMQAAGALPGLYGQQARDALTAGSIQDQQAQNEINASMGAFNEGRDRQMQVVGQALPYFMQAGQAFGDRTAEQYGASSGTGTTKGTTTTTENTSPFQQIMGGAMMGLGAMSGLGGMAPFGGMASLFGGQPASYAPMTAASAGMMNNYAPANNPVAMGGYGYQVPQQPYYGPAY